MFDEPSAGVSDDARRGLIGALAAGGPQPDDEARIERIRRLDELEAAVGAARAVETAAFVSSQREQQAAAGVPPATSAGR